MPRGERDWISGWCQTQSSLETADLHRRCAESYRKHGGKDGAFVDCSCLHHEHPDLLDVAAHPEQPTPEPVPSTRVAVRAQRPQRRRKATT